MELLAIFISSLAFRGLALAIILQNGQARCTDYPNTVIDASPCDFISFAPSAPQLSYKGRWDSKYISWSSASGLEFGFTGEEVAITFGPYTTDSILIGYRIDGQDWHFINVTTNATHLLVSSKTPGVNISTPINPSTFELRVTDWAYGVQTFSVHVAKGSKIFQVPSFTRTIEVIGDPLSAGQYATLEGSASYSNGLGAGLETEYSVEEPLISREIIQKCGNPRSTLPQTL